MSIVESAFLFDCMGDELPGIIAAPAAAQTDIGVLVVVGGPQYRVGSHRQFVLLARHLAQRGIHCMRFDYRGMGDATGEARSFEAVDEDIGAAVDVFLERAPGVKRVVLWGLCDGASAACFYARLDPRIAGTLLLNPWVKTAVSEARTFLKHYYLQRLLDPAFWKKLLGGGVSVGRALRGLIGTAQTAARDGQPAPTSDHLPLPERMASGLVAAARPCHIVLSGRDYVAREFEGVATTPLWVAVGAASEPTRLALADHTFSSAVWRDEVAELTADWVLSLARDDKEKAR